MFRFLKQQFWLNSTDRHIILALAAGLGLLAETVIAAATLVSRDPDTVLLASGLVLVIGLFMVTMVFAGYFFIEFDIGLSMGATRRRMLAAGLFNSLCLEGVLLLATAAVRGLEWGVYTGWLQKAQPGLSLAVDFMAVLLGLPWWGKLLLLAGPVFLGYVSGVLIQRFGRMGFWILWGVFMVGFVLPSNSAAWIDLDTLTLQPGLLAVVGWAAALAAALLAAGAAWLALHSSVRGG